MKYKVYGQQNMVVWEDIVFKHPPPIKVHADKAEFCEPPAIEDKVPVTQF